LEEATYLLGMLAGGMTKSNVIGVIGGMRLPVIKSTFDAFESGAKSVNPKARVLTNYVGNFEDQNAAKEASRAMISQRADVLFHNADQAGKGMFNAAQEAKGVLVFGSNRNQNNVAPGVCLASAVIELPRAFVQLARDVQENRFKAEFRELNLPKGTIAVEWNTALKGKVPPALLQKVNAAEKKIKGGGLKIKRNV
jgi:basic membrane lipoprotein Med (substrate-binding protein (PBP1-ABC) superfamily)